MDNHTRGLARGAYCMSGGREGRRDTAEAMHIER